MACSWSPFPNYFPSAHEYTLSFQADRDVDGYSTLRAGMKVLVEPEAILGVVCVEENKMSR